VTTQGRKVALIRVNLFQESNTQSETVLSGDFCPAEII